MSNDIPQYCFACQQSFLNAQAYAAHTCTPQRLAAEVNRQSFVDRLRQEPRLVDELLGEINLNAGVEIGIYYRPRIVALRALVLAWAARVEAAAAQDRPNERESAIPSDQEPQYEK